MNSLKGKSGTTHLPKEFVHGHELCFLLHDYLAQIVVSAEQQGLLVERMVLRDDADRAALASADDVFAWLDATDRKVERAAVFRRVVAHRLLSDALHFVYEALESSRKAKLTVTYALLRKPLQESLFALEAIALDLDVFARDFVEDVLRLRSQKFGGAAAHTARIEKLVSEIDGGARFSAQYLAQLRYDKNAEDGFDGSCNKATHLITSADALRTEPMNLNFIFSDWDAKLSQWRFLYTRLPYLLEYMRCVVEHIYAEISPTDPAYLADLTARRNAGIILWSTGVSEDYRTEELRVFVEAARRDMKRDALARGSRIPSLRELERLRTHGAWPGESSLLVRARHLRYAALAAVSRRLARRWGATGASESWQNIR